MILPEPQRTLPLTVHPEIVRGVMCGRIRLLFVPTAQKFALLQPNDMVWVREPLFIPPRQSGQGMLDVVYGSDGAQRSLVWPRALARPALGQRLPPSAMPVHVSRLTLVVASAVTMRLQQLDEQDALEAGVLLERDGFSNPLALSGQQLFHAAHEAFGHFWDCALGADAMGPNAWTCNPEVVALRFRAIARNISDLVPGIGRGGAR